MSPVAVARSSSDDNAIRYITPVLWMFAPTGRLVTCRGGNALIRRRGCCPGTTQCPRRTSVSVCLSVCPCTRRCSLKAAKCYIQLTPTIAYRNCSQGSRRNTNSLQSPTMGCQIKVDIRKICHPFPTNLGTAIRPNHHHHFICSEPSNTAYDSKCKRTGPKGSTSAKNGP